MAANVANFKVGHAELTLGGVAIGHTKGGVEITVTQSLYEKKVDKYGDAVVGMVHTGDRVEVKAYFAESDLTHLNKAIATSTLTTGSTKNDVGIGKEVGDTMSTATLVVHPVDAGVSTADDWNFPKVIAISNPTLIFKPDEERVYEVIFLAIIDESATDGEKLVRIGTSD